MVIACWWSGWTWQLKKVHTRFTHVSPSRRNYWTTSCKECSLQMSLLATPYPSRVGVWGSYSWTREAAHQHCSLERTILSATCEGIWTWWDGSRDQPHAQIWDRCSCYPKMPLSRLGPAEVNHKRSGYTDQSGAQSICRPHTKSQRPRYEWSPRGSCGLVLDSNTIAKSRGDAGGGVGVMASRALACRMMRKPPRIPPPAWEMWGPWAHNRLDAPPPSWTPGSQGLVGAPVWPLMGSSPAPP
jgi:hypothetical protein